MENFSHFPLSIFHCPLTKKTGHFADPGSLEGFELSKISTAGSNDGSLHVRVRNYFMRSMFYFGGLLVALAALNISMCAQYDGFKEAKVLSSPKVALPKEAKVTGLGGKVSVLVSVDEAGNVTAVEHVSGPGSVCTLVTRTDVLAMRRLAIEAAMKSKFSPATRNGVAERSSTSIGFEFTASKTDESGEEPKYYSGPVSAAEGDSNGVLNFKAISLPKPPYPPAARAVKASGSIGIQVLIDEDGSIFSAEAVSGHPLLRAAARGAACEAKFTPTMLEGKPVKVAGIITYNFVP